MVAAFFCLRNTAMTRGGGGGDIAQSTRDRYSPRVMKNSPLLRTAVFTLAYIIIFIVIVVVQFPAAGPFSLAVAGVAVRGVPEADGEGLRSIELSAAGLRLSFSAKEPFSYTDAGGSTRESAPEAYRVLDEGIAIDFFDGSTLSVTVKGDGRTEWVVQTPRTASTATLRFDLARGALSLPPSREAPVRLSLGGLEYRVTGIGTGQEQNLITLQSRNGVLSPFHVAPFVQGPTTAPPEYLSLKPLDAAAWTRELASWREQIGRAHV